MSGEFRESSGYYFHSQLENVEPEGNEILSKLLYRVYKAIAPLEHATAWVEAGDSVSSECIVQAALSAFAVRDACRKLITYCDDQEALAKRLIEDTVRVGLGTRS
jgi:hypothetical protein